MSEHTELPWRYCATEGGWDGVESDDGQLIARLSLNNPANAHYIVLACNTFADIEEGISTIVRKDHYYQLEAQAKSQPDLLAACEWINAFIATASDGGDAWCAVRNQPGAKEWATNLATAIKKAQP